MRKKNRSPMEPIQKARNSDVAATPYEAGPQNNQPLSLESDPLALIRPKWAGFRMERAFWSAMRRICACEGITAENFITLAMGHSPDCPPVAAVRLGITQYYRQGCVLPTETIGGSPVVITNPSPPKVTATASRTLHVLVVDDVEMNRDIAGSFLRAAGHTTTCVEGGSEAIAAIKTTDFDVVLMDVRMPEMDGLQATRRIRAFAGARGRVPIVALTARAFTEQVAECREAGMDSHVAKPFTPDTLLTAVLQAAGVGPTDSQNVIKLKPSARRPTPPRAVEALMPASRAGRSLLTTSLSEGDGTVSGRLGTDVQLEATYWAGVDRICKIDNSSFQTFVTDARERYPHYAADIAVRVAVATYFFERADVVSTFGPVSTSPVIGSGRLILDQTAFERTAYFLPSETIDTYIRAIAERAEALLSDLLVTKASRCSDNQLAEAASAVAGSAGMFGFDRLTRSGCCFERAIEAGSADSPALADGLRSALEDTLSVIQNRRFATADV